jgi:pimeloyl-ACP methyl ester carboxylesterase
MTGRLQHLVVVIPGFGGSVLEDGNGSRRWGPGFGDITRGMVWAGPLSVSEQPQLAPVGLLPTVTVIPPFVLPGYDRLVRQIEEAFTQVRVDEVQPGRDRDPGADVVLFPYDFRLGVRAAAYRLKADIDARLADLTEQARSRRVIVVGHSMGGLVARYWLGPLGGSRVCRGLITVATPHQGVPKAMDWLVNGVRVGRVSLHRMTEVSREWPGVYDLLPRYPAVLARGHPEGRAGGEPRLLYPLELGSVLAAGFAARAADSLQAHAEIGEAWRGLAHRPDGPELATVFARGHATPSRAVLSGGKLRVTRSDPEWLPNQGWRGDGTVPAISAIPPERDDGRRAWYQVPERHLSMVATPAVIQLLRFLDGAAPAPPPTERGGRPWIGLELDAAVLPGEPIAMAAQVLGAAGDAASAWVTVRPAGRPGPPRRYRLSPAGGRWQGVIPARGPGAYALLVQAMGIPGVGQLRCAEVIGVAGL